jgi:predicted exporter
MVGDMMGWEWWLGCVFVCTCSLRLLWMLVAFGMLVFSDATLPCSCTAVLPSSEMEHPSHVVPDNSWVWKVNILTAPLR